MSSSSLSRKTEATRQDPANSVKFTSFDYVQPLQASKPHWDSIKIWSYKLKPIKTPQFILADLPTLVFQLSGAVTMQIEDSYHQHHKARAVRNTLYFVPNSAPITMSWKVPASYVNVAINLHTFTQLANVVSSTDPSRLELVERYNFNDPLIQQLMLALLTELEATEDWGRVYVESLAQTLALHLIHQYSNWSGRRNKLPGKRLTPNQILQIQDYIYDQLDRDLSLAELAESVGLSPFHFTRLFKGATGQSPYQFLLEQRVERAKELLIGGNITIAEVAQKTGFADQSHLTRHFRRRLGVSPKAILKGS